MSKLTPPEAVTHAPDLLTLIRAVARAASKDSPGGRKITPSEWLALGEEMGLLALAVVKDAVD